MEKYQWRNCSSKQCREVLQAELQQKQYSEMLVAQ